MQNQTLPSRPRTLATKLLPARLALLAIFALLCAGLPAGAHAAAPTLPPDPPAPRPAFLARQPAGVQAGYALFVDKGCYLCHGHVGQGSPMSGPALAVDAPFEYLKHFVRTPRSQMPPYFPEVLSDEEIARIAVYLQAIPADKPAAELPMLNAVQPR